MKNQETLEGTISIVDRNGWDSIWSKVIAAYWSNYSTFYGNRIKSNVLYDLLTEVGVDNVIPVGTKQESSVYFLSKPFELSKSDLSE